MTATTLVLARRELEDAVSEAPSRRVLLEGSWPGGDAARGDRVALDDALDARCAWIDDEAARLADLAAGEGPNRDIYPPAAWIDALALRYALVRWIRVLALPEILPVRRRDSLELLVAADRDADYATLLRQVCARAGADLCVRWMEREAPPRPPVAPNGRLRRVLGRLASAAGREAASSPPRARVVLFGNPRVLDPVAAELMRRRARVWWLYDRFAVRAWLRWRPRGADQLVCDSSSGRADRIPDRCPMSLPCRGYDLGPVVGPWLAARLDRYGAAWTRLAEQVERHLARVRPAAVILDEDATPHARIVVAAARRHGAATWVVQHGAPFLRFGFAPLAADRACVWGEAAARQLQRWGVAPSRIERTGSPWHDGLRRSLRAARKARGRRVRRRDWLHGPRLLLLATVPPRDERPDPVAFHLTRSTYAALVRAAFSTAARLPGARLTVKLHPRAPRDPIVESALRSFPQVRGRLVRRTSLASCLADCDCVLSCVSSAGIDALLADVPVIQLLPAGSGDVMPAGEWGLTGSARSEPELWDLLGRALEHRGLRSPLDGPGPFEPFERPAAARIVDAVLAGPHRRAHPAEPHVPAPHAPRVDAQRRCSASSGSARWRDEEAP